MPNVECNIDKILWINLNVWELNKQSLNQTLVNGKNLIFVLNKFQDIKFFPFKV